MSIPAVEPAPEPLDYVSTILATAYRVKIAFEDSPAVPHSRTMEAAEMVWGLIYGQLRGRIPYPVPPDLMSVAVSAGTRILKGFAFTGTAFIKQGQFNDVADLRPWSGFMVVERVILNRYRQRTA